MTSDVLLAKLGSIQSALDPAILEQIVARHLTDLEEFADAIKRCDAAR